jgi:2-keto-4-pentenoate hydratase/2-oxohepta-3-ene-1,7-dioic acid hydratase in catechol pathway
MKLYTVEHQRRQRLAAQRDDLLVDISAVAPDMLSLIRGGDSALGAARDALAASKVTYAPNQVRILAPIPRPGKVLCSGLNYRSHVEENPGATFLDDPRFFVKLSQCVIGPGEAIRIPQLGMDLQVDYEVELAVIIGRPIYRGRAGDVMGSVFGYSILHDVSARHIQFKDKNEDMGKNFDTFAPMGPCIVTADEIPDPAGLRLRSFVNGKKMQDGSNRDWCFSLPRMLEWFSMGITLDAGDVVTTGTPSGIGFFRKPQVFLKPGDVCRLEIDSIGALENPVIGD